MSSRELVQELESKVDVEHLNIDQEADFWGLVTSSEEEDDYSDLSLATSPNRPPDGYHTDGLPIYCCEGPEGGESETLSQDQPEEEEGDDSEEERGNGANLPVDRAAEAHDRAMVEYELAIEEQAENLALEVRFTAERIHRAAVEAEKRGDFQRAESLRDLADTVWTL